MKALRKLVETQGKRSLINLISKDTNLVSNMYVGSLFKLASSTIIDFCADLTSLKKSFKRCNVMLCLYPRYEVYRGYIVFAFSVIMFVCLSVCL